LVKNLIHSSIIVWNVSVIWVLGRGTSLGVLFKTWNFSTHNFHFMLKNKNNVHLYLLYLLHGICHIDLFAIHWYRNEFWTKTKIVYWFLQRGPVTYYILPSSLFISFLIYCHRKQYYSTFNRKWKMILCFNYLWPIYYL